MNRHPIPRSPRKPLLSVAGLEHELRDRNTGGRFLVRVPGLALYQGEFVALMGPTGVGKSTLLQILALLRRPTRVGEFTLLDAGAPGRPPVWHDVREHWQRGRQRAIERLRGQLLGYVPQHPQLLPALSVRENVEIPLRLNRVPGARDRVHELLAALSHPAPEGQPDLLQRAGHRPHEISGGQAQRVCVARAAAHDPPLLLADEPTSSLDPRTARRVLQFLDGLRRRGAGTVVMVTHDEGLAGEFADRVIRLALVDQDVGGVIADEPTRKDVLTDAEDDGAVLDGAARD